MGTKGKTFEKPPNKLRCYVCMRANRRGDKLRVSNDVVYRRRFRRGDEDSHRYAHVAIDCLTCGHQWYSMHPDAVAKSHKLDENLARHHGGQR